MENILFICTGNSCRSPMAAAIAERIFADRGLSVRIRSAGIHAGGGGASHCAKEAVKRYGGDLSHHTVRGVTAETLEWADLIITMTRTHKVLVESLMQDSATERIFTIYEYAENSDKDVQDPFGGDLDVYRECAGELFNLLNRIADRFLCQKEV